MSDAPNPAAAAPQRTEVYTDGACSGNPGPGGWGWVATDGRRGSGGEIHSTNQRMELQAVLEALRAIDGVVTVFSDSTYVVKGINDRWFEGWKKRGWKNSANKPVANRDLWEPLIELYLDRSHELTFVWVKGHAGNRMNEIADQLAVAAAAQIRSGEPTPNPLAPPWPVEHTVWFTGAATLDDDQHELLERSVVGLDPGTDVVLTGLRRGVELLAAERALEAGVTIAVVLPFAEPAMSWPDDERRRFDAALQAAEWVVTLDGDRTKPTAAIAARNDWAADAAVGAVVLGDPHLAASLDDRGVSVVSG